MKFHIRKWSENTVVLMNDSGNVLAYFRSINEALDACSLWYESNTRESKQDVAVYQQQGSCKPVLLQSRFV